MIHGNSLDNDGPYRSSIRALSFSTESGRHTKLSLVGAILWKDAWNATIVHPAMQPLQPTPRKQTASSSSCVSGNISVFVRRAVRSAQRLMEPSNGRDESLLGRLAWSAHVASPLHHAPLKFEPSQTSVGILHTAAVQQPFTVDSTTLQPPLHHIHYDKRTIGFGAVRMCLVGCTAGL